VRAPPSVALLARPAVRRHGGAAAADLQRAAVRPVRFPAWRLDLALDRHRRPRAQRDQPDPQDARRLRDRRGVRRSARYAAAGNEHLDLPAGRRPVDADPGRQPGQLSRTRRRHRRRPHGAGAPRPALRQTAADHLLRHRRRFADLGLDAVAGRRRDLAHRLAAALHAPQAGRRSARRSGRRANGDAQPAAQAGSTLRRSRHRRSRP